MNVARKPGLGREMSIVIAVGGCQSEITYEAWETLTGKGSNRIAVRKRTSSCVTRILIKSTLLRHIGRTALFFSFFFFSSSCIFNKAE